jgi:hypothetical protein
MAKEIWTTPMEPTDVAVVYPGDTRERHLGAPVYLGFPIGDAMTKPTGTVVLTMSAAGGWSANSTPNDRYGPGAEMFKDSSEQIARKMVRTDGNVRSLHIAYMGKVAVERKPFFVHCDGFTDAEVKRFGFAGAFTSFDAALAAATEASGNPNGSISCCFPRGLQWRMIPRVPD